MLIANCCCSTGIESSLETQTDMESATQQSEDTSLPSTSQEPGNLPGVLWGFKWSPIRKWPSEWKKCQWLLLLLGGRRTKASSDRISQSTWYEPEENDDWLNVECKLCTVWQRAFWAFSLNDLSSMLHKDWYHCFFFNYCVVIFYTVFSAETVQFS